MLSVLQRSLFFLTLALALVQGAGLLPSSPLIQARHTDLPLRFEVNQGQAPSSVDFIVRGGEYPATLQSGEAVLGGAPARMRLSGARATRAEGLDPLETVTNYFIGSDPSRWRTGIRNYSRVRYRDVLPGVDLVYSGNAGRLEYSLTFAPGTDVGAVSVAFDGVTAARAGPGGELILGTASGELVQTRPGAFQFAEGRKIAVPVRFRIDAPGRIGFIAQHYDRSSALIIDPVLSFSTYVGGREWDEGVGMALDASNNVYVAGWTTSPNLPARGPQRKFGGGRVYGDAFVFKLNSTGTKLLYCTYLGGDGDDDAWALAVDAAGAAYVTGATASADFPVTARALQSWLPGQASAFVAKLDASGGRLVYSTYLGGDRQDKGLGIAVDSSGSAVVAGRTTSSNFPVTAAALQKTNLGRDDIFVAKLDPAGNTLRYSTLIGGSGDDWANAVALDSSGAAYLTGFTQSPDFPVTAGAPQSTFYGGTGDGFAAKLNPAGSALVYSTFLGGPAEDFGRAIAVDAGGSAYVGGRTASPTFPITTGAFQTRLGGKDDCFVTKLDAAGSLAYSTFLGGSEAEQIEGLAIDPSGAAHVVGLTRSQDYPLTAGALRSSLEGIQKAMVTKLSPDGSSLLFSSFLGGSGGTDIAINVAADPAGNTFVMGLTKSIDFPITRAAFQRKFRGGRGDVFVARIDYGR